MCAVRASAALRDRLGHDGTMALLELVDAAGADWKGDVMLVVADRFERRLVEELSTLRREIHQGHVDMIKWSFVFWVGQLAALAGIVAVLVRTLAR